MASEWQHTHTHTAVVRTTSVRHRSTRRVELTLRHALTDFDRTVIPDERRRALTRAEAIADAVAFAWQRG